MKKIRFTTSNISFLAHGIEILEARIAPATLIVNTALDVVAADGLVSLREAIQAANTNAAVFDAPAGSAAGDVILFDGTFFGPGRVQTIPLLLGEFSITDDLRISGLDAATGLIDLGIVIDAGLSSRVFTVDANDAVTLSDISLANGDSGAGGSGGGIFVSAGDSVTLRNVAVSDSVADVNGGGVYNEGTLTVDGSNFAGNTALGALATQGGGGIFNNGGTVNIFGGSTFTGNDASGTLGSGGGIFNSSGTLFVVSSFVGTNSALRAGGGIETNAGTVTVIDSTLDDNFAGINGGGFHTTGAARVVISGGSVTTNIAGQEGGGLWNSSTGSMFVRTYQGAGTLIGGNTANGDSTEQGGGGVFNDGGTFMITGATISGNVAAAAAVGNGGGGIFNDGRMVLTGVTISANTATNGTGNGGGILNSNGGSLTITGSTITDNSAARAGGGIENNIGSVVITDTDLVNNTTGINGGGFHTSGVGSVTINGGGIFDNVAGQEGGGLWNSSTGTMIIQSSLSFSSVISGNRADGNGTEQGGGGIFNDGGPVTIIDATIENNSSTATAVGNGGGGIFNDGLMTITNTSIQENTATDGSANGGGILNSNGGILTINFGALYDNSTARAGGGIENNAGTVTITGLDMDNNFAGINGGAIHTSGAGSVTINDSFVTANFAGNEGGGLWNSSTGSMTVGSTTVAFNDANFGGGIHNDGGPLFIGLSTIHNNTATSEGGGINSDFSSGQQIQIVSSTVGENSTTNGNGGGISATGGTILIIHNSTIANNSANNAGGGIYAASSTVTLVSTILAGNDDITGPGEVSRFQGTLNATSSLFQVTPAAGTINGTNTANLIGQDPLLSSLVDNGGLTLTYFPAAGSPAIDAGANPFDFIADQRGFPRTLGFGTDIGSVENDFVPAVQHYAVSSGKTDRVDVFDTLTGTFLFNFDAFSGNKAIKKGVTVATGDVTGDGIEDIIVGGSKGKLGSTVKVFDGIDGGELESFVAFPGAFSGGVTVAAGDINGDGRAEIIVGAEKGRLVGPGVLIFDPFGTDLGSIDAYPGFSGGIRVAAGDVNGDGFDDIITGAGSGAGPHVKVFSGETGAQIDSFFAYPGFKGGVFVAAGDVTGDGRAEIITGNDSGARANVRIFERGGFGQRSEIHLDFFAFDERFTGGIRVAAGDIDGDGIAEIIAGSGKSGTPEVVIFDGNSGLPIDILPLPDPEYRSGVFVG